MRLIVEDGRVAGAVLSSPEGETEIRTRRGVVLACGGFPHDVERKRQLFPHAPSGVEHWSAAPPSNTGDGLRLGESAGGSVDTTREGRTIPGLYACGNDMNSIMGGRYPSGGITLGPAMTFGYIAAHDAAGVNLGDAPLPATQAREHTERRAANR